MINTFEAKLHNDRKGIMRQYRYLTPDECKTFGTYSPRHCQMIDKYGDIREVKITSVKTWKTRPDIEVRWKYGLYEYGAELITPNRPNQFFVKEVE